MLNLRKLDKNQSKEFAKYLLDISKAGVIGSIAFNSFSNNNISKGLQLLKK